MSLGPQIVPFGNIQASYILTPVLAPVNTAIGLTVEQNFNVPGLQVGDIVSVTAQFAISTLMTIENSRVSANSTLTIAFNNPTAGLLAYPTGLFAIEVNRPYPGLAMTSIQ